MRQPATWLVVRVKLKLTRGSALIQSLKTSRRPSNWVSILPAPSRAASRDSNPLSARLRAGQAL